MLNLTISETIILLNGVTYRLSPIFKVQVTTVMSCLLDLPSNKIKIMSTKFFSKLSQNYIELLKDDEYYDITIEVGEDPNVKIFRAHMNILCYRSPYLRRTLASKKTNNDNVLAHIKLSNISPEIFQIILE